MRLFQQYDNDKKPGKLHFHAPIRLLVLLIAYLYIDRTEISLHFQFAVQLRFPIQLPSLKVKSKIITIIITVIIIIIIIEIIIIIIIIIIMYLIKIWGYGKSIFIPVTTLNSVLSQAQKDIVRPHNSENSFLTGRKGMGGKLGGGGGGF